MKAEKLVPDTGKARRAIQRAERNRDSQALQRIHGKIQAKPAPPKEGDHHDIHEGYTVTVRWGRQSRKNRPGVWLVLALIYDNRDNRRIGNCTFVYQEEGQLPRGRNQQARFTSRGIRKIR